MGVAQYFYWHRVAQNFKKGMGRVSIHGHGVPNESSQAWGTTKLARHGVPK